MKHNLILLIVFQVLQLSNMKINDLRLKNEIQFDKYYVALLQHLVEKKHLKIFHSNFIYTFLMCLFMLIFALKCFTIIHF